MKYSSRFSRFVIREIDEVLYYTKTHFGEKKHQDYRELIELLSAILRLTHFGRRQNLGPNYMRRPSPFISPREGKGRGTISFTA
jgi:hypothetical protein